LTRAVLRASQILGLTQKQLAAVLGVSEAGVSRLDRGRNIEPATKEGEIAILFLRLWRSLDALMGGSDTQARDWMHASNTHLGGIPSDLIQNLTGIMRVAEYLDAMRGKL
jgi:transcriptional regulator with XRE-family HTH domain